MPNSLVEFGIFFLSFDFGVLSFEFGQLKTLNSKLVYTEGLNILTESAVWRV